LQIRIPFFSEEQDPYSHQSEKLDPDLDPNPRQKKKTDPDPRIRDIGNWQDVPVLPFI
jgi:hypothetical protein